MNNKAKYGIEISDGKFLKSFNGSEMIMSDKDSARTFRTKMEAEIFTGVYGGIESLEQYSVHKGKGFPRIIEL